MHEWILFIKHNLGTNVLCLWWLY